jgi:hypothetical protein
MLLGHMYIIFYVSAALGAGNAPITPGSCVKPRHIHHPHLPRLCSPSARHHVARLHFQHNSNFSTFDASRIVFRSFGPGPPHPRCLPLQRS